MEYAQALSMIKVGRTLVPMSDPLRQSLNRVAHEVQAAIDDGATLTEYDLAMLYAMETKETCDHFADKTEQTQSNYACTLFIFTRHLMQAHDKQGTN
jgi:hypothetical protein